MSPRTRIPRETASIVLLKARRRCALCFGIHRDAGVKRGQIAHLDHDRDNNDLANLAFLCLDHHDQYDSRSSQSKGLTITEVRVFRAELEEAIRSALAAPITLAAVTPGEWTGVYRLESANESAELTIERTAENGWRVRGIGFWGTNRQYGPNIGDIDEMAVQLNDRLLVSIGGYSLTLSHAPRGLEAKEDGEPGPFGMNVSFSGTYHRVPAGAQALPQPPMRPFESEFWPEAGIPVFRARSTSLTLRSRPASEAPVEALASVGVDQKIEFSHFRYRTVRPGRVLVRRPAEISGRVLGTTDYVSRANYHDHGGETVTIELVPGDTFEYLQYRAEHTGFIRWEGLVLELDTLPWALTHSDFQLVADPIAESWILAHVEQSSGWLLVDESVDETDRVF